MPALRRLLFALLLLALVPVAAQAAPSWWRVSDGRSEVWILGAPRIVPKDLAWDTSATEHHLAGATQLIVGPRPRGSLQVAGLIFSSFSSQPLETTLPPPLRQRFVAVRTALGKPAQHYANWKPAAASKLLLDDFFAANGFEETGIENSVARLAHGKGVRDVPAGVYDQTVLYDQAKGLSTASQLTCLDAAVHDVERGAGLTRAVAAGWARGETNDLPIDRIDQACVATLPAIGAQADLTLTQETAAAAGAPSGPGHAVAVFELHNLTQPGGVIDRLRARGLQVTGPAS